MVTAAIKKLQHLIDFIPAELLNIPESEFKLKPALNKWSKQQIVGHLIDSATNNHHRIIRMQYEKDPVIFYNQNKWNELNHYQLMERKHVIEFWKIYNKHLLEVIKHLPANSLARECNTGGRENVTLQWIIDDYIIHLEHHLKQIINY